LNLQVQQAILWILDNPGAMPAVYMFNIDICKPHFVSAQALKFRGAPIMHHPAIPVINPTSPLTFPAMTVTNYLFADPLAAILRA
jgi:hypothetical protein